MADFALDKNFKGLNDTKLLSSRVERTFDQLIDLFNQNNGDLASQFAAVANLTNQIAPLQTQVAGIASSVASLVTLVLAPIPASSTSTGTAGQIAVDTTNNLFYLCYATNAWLQISVGTTF